VDIIEMFNDFHDGRLDVSRLNYGIITATKGNRC
jgi:hypothetical protein